MFIALGKPVVEMQANRLAGDPPPDIHLIRPPHSTLGWLPQIHAAVILAILVNLEIQLQLKVTVFRLGLQHTPALRITVLPGDKLSLGHSPICRANRLPAVECVGSQ